MKPVPMRMLVSLLRMCSSRDAANAHIGDIVEELNERQASGQGPRWPGLWLTLHVTRAITSAILTRMPGFVRSGGLVLRDAARALRAAPAQAFFIVLVLAVGITAGTVTFSVVDAVLLRPLPIEEPHQVVTIRGQDFK